MRSKFFPILDKKEIGLIFLRSPEQPFLGIGIRRADFPGYREVLVIQAVVKVDSETFMKLEIPSGPNDFSLFDRIIATSASSWEVKKEANGSHSDYVGWAAGVKE